MQVSAEPCQHNQSGSLKAWQHAQQPAFAAKSACNHLRGYAGQDLCHVVYAKVLHLVGHTLYSRDVYGFWSAQHHLQQWVSLQHQTSDVGSKLLPLWHKTQSVLDKLHQQLLHQLLVIPKDLDVRCEDGAHCQTLYCQYVHAVHVLAGILQLLVPQAVAGNSCSQASRFTASLQQVQSIGRPFK